MIKYNGSPCFYSIRASKGSHSKKKGPRTPSPPPPVPLDLPVVGKKHKGKHKNKEKTEEKQKEGKDRGRDTEKHKEKKEKRRYSVDPFYHWSAVQLWLIAFYYDGIFVHNDFFKFNVHLSLI